jgi:transposase
MKKKTTLNQIRIYAEDLKKEIVKQIEEGQITVIQACRAYGISSQQTVYTWLYKYSRNLKKGTRLVMEKDSMDNSLKALQKQIKELEAALGRKSMEADLYKAIVDLASKEYQTDLKKNFGDQASGSSKNPK